MNIIASFSNSLNNLKSNKVRTGLTLLGIIIGIMAIVLLVSVITGTRAKIEGEIISAGSNVFFVFPGNYEVMSGPPTMFVVNKLKLRYLDLLEARSNYEVRACPEYDLMGAVVKYKRESRKSTLIWGTYANMSEIYNWKVSSGKFFEDKDVETTRKVVVIGKTIVRDFFAAVNPIGKEISIKGIKFRIIGVMTSKERILNFDMDDIVIMPITTAYHLTGSSEINQITLKVSNANDVDKAVLETKRILKMVMDKKDFTVSSQGEMLKMFHTFANILSIVTGIIAGISLLVGGIGIMNVMLATVTERTREIGIRKAVGASFYDILLQFMVEAVLVALIGGLFGIVFSLIVIFVLTPFVPFPLKASFPSIILAVGFSSIVGIFFGTYPAIKAAKVDPIVALKYE